LFPIHFVAAIERQHSLPEGFYLREKGLPVCLRIHGYAPLRRLKVAVDNVGQQLYHLFGCLGDSKSGAVDLF